MYAISALAVAAALGFAWYRSRDNLTAPSAVVEGTAGFQALRGRWIRPDGGYVMEIRSVADTGRMETAYFNPNPIHVSRAEASRKGEAVIVFIELRDVNYPGSTYTLIHEPKSDQLEGIYYQAATGQSYEVFFRRME